MSIQVSLLHRTTYEYDREVVLHPQVVRLKPAPHSRTKINSYSLRILPDNHFINWQQDPFGNFEARLVFPEKTKRFEVVVDLVAEMVTINPFDFFLEEYSETFPFEYPESLRISLQPYLTPSDPSSAVAYMARELLPESEMPMIDFLVEINQAVEKLINYNIRMEPGVQSCDETLEKQSGSCRDSAYFLIQLFRHMGLAARFVSGYLIQLTPDEMPLDGPGGPSEDFTDLHAWTEVFIPGAGWVGVDPTSGLMATEGHIPLACTPEPSTAAPISGNIEPCECEFSFENKITRTREAPRVTKPYSPEVWDTIHRTGQLVDERLARGDVRLTMGGEPTFVSVDDMEGEEWNTAADSPMKRGLGFELTKKLRDHFGPGGMIWVGEGKWYPGEPVPRWAYGVYWRRDGSPVCCEDVLEPNPTESGSYGAEEPARLLEEVAKNLGIPRSLVCPVYEDADYYRWKISGLPVDADPGSFAEDDSIERKTLARLEKRGLDTPSGSVLPVFVDQNSGLWRGAEWKFRRDKLYLIPGDSSIGVRLPLDSIRDATEKDLIEVRSPLETDEDNSLPEDFLERYRHGETEEVVASSGGGWVPRTALAVEVREGNLCVFFPPTSTLEQYLTLFAAVEKACKDTGLRVVPGGYEPPPDARLESLKVTPDPGVIEVNIHPSSSWEELVRKTKDLYKLARETRLGTEKFMLDGKHTGTGGGNHVVIGGATPADSPFLRRADLLASLVGFWQHHPGLSYLFSGAFIGPTSQAPRLDEGRDDRVYELEIALSALHDGISEPFLIDRIMRHLLTDLTGNTHRAEICIDKLCSPDSSSGQLGLVELRGFEMPPHREMSLVQALLVRSLIAHFWEKPYRNRPIRWGSTLHDKFLLPHFVWEDMAEVCETLQTGEIPFQLEWLRPFWDFRFPKYGEVAKNGVKIELRGALEPWHVLGEEAGSHGTARFVDSSMERLQIRVSGFVEERHVVTCNGRRIPLYPTNAKQEWVGGVRFKAWSPPSSLHPMIPVQSPLVFDLIDTWSQKSLGGCVYHVSHPGGRSYDTFPVNALEAESRRESRFWNEGHTPGPIRTDPVLFDLSDGPVRTMEEHAGGEAPRVVPFENMKGENPHTLDLRSPSGNSLLPQ
ncbi:MAG: transglutaminase family protein [Verrucomicrobiales bacterium]|nr:transglutaminase family protein [Verrucomicrobiales bacterium]